MAWINVNKPTGASYTNVNPQGKEQYDQANITFDDSGTYYDGINTGVWNNVGKPINGLSWSQANYTWASFQHPWQSSSWSNENKPTS